MGSMRTCAVLLSVTLASAASAHLGEIVYPIYELPTSDLPGLHDGTLEDWEEALPLASLNHNDFLFRNIGLGGGIDPSDLAVRVFLAWHHASQRIFVAVERLDDVYLDPSVGCCGEGYTQLFVDGDHSGGQFGFLGDEFSEEESDRRSYAQAQMYSVRPENFSDHLFIVPQHLTWTTQPPWGDAGGFQYGDAPNLSVVEFAITPWDDLDWHGSELSRRSSLEPGKIIGFHVEVHDSDEADRASGEYVLALPTVHAEVKSGDLEYWHYFFADNFVDGELVPCDRGDCSRASTAVKLDSWGRIKASFR